MATSNLFDVLRNSESGEEVEKVVTFSINEDTVKDESIW